MATTMLPYSVRHYNSLPELEEADVSLELVWKFVALLTDLGSTFLKHHVKNKFAIILLHNHFLLNENEMLVSIGNVTIPWNIASGAKEFENVKAVCWRFVGDGVTPYEFAYCTTTVPSLEDEAHAPFL